MGSSRIGLAGTLQIAVLIQLRQFSQTLLQFLPSTYPLSRGLLRSFGNIVASGFTLLPSIAHIQMRTMLGSSPLAMAARSSAGTVRFRQRSEDGDLCQTFHLAQQLASLGSRISGPGHGASYALDRVPGKTDSW